MYSGFEIFFALALVVLGVVNWVTRERNLREWNAILRWSARLQLKRADLVGSVGLAVAVAAAITFLILAGNS